ncbi:hypothetical protein MASR2M29_01040 [Spirochaetota bacterium]
MLDQNNDIDNIAAGIIAEAEVEAKAVLAEADKYVKNLELRTKDESLIIEKDAASRIKVQLDAIKAEALSKAAIEKRKGSLAFQEEIAASIIKEAEEIILELRKSPSYPDIIKAWIVEAAIGLSAESASVNSAKDDGPFITEKMLKEAEEEVYKLSGKKTKLHKIDGDPVLGQGVYLKADDGRLAYDNRTKARFDRERSAVRRHIYEALAKLGISGSKL